MAYRRLESEFDGDWQYVKIEEATVPSAHTVFYWDNAYWCIDKKRGAIVLWNPVNGPGHSKRQRAYGHPQCNRNKFVAETLNSKGYGKEFGWVVEQIPNVFLPVESKDFGM